MSRKEEPRLTPRRKARIEIEADDFAKGSGTDSEDEDEVVGEVWSLIWPLASGLCSFPWSVRGSQGSRFVIIEMVSRVLAIAGSSDLDLRLLYGCRLIYAECRMYSSIMP